MLPIPTQHFLKQTSNFGNYVRQIRPICRPIGSDAKGLLYKNKKRSSLIGPFFSPLQNISTLNRPSIIHKNIKLNYTTHRKTQDRIVENPEPIDSTKPSSPPRTSSSKRSTENSSLENSQTTQTPTNLQNLRLAVGDNLSHGRPGLKLTPQIHMPSLLVDADNPPPPLPNDIHYTYAWFRGAKLEGVQQGMSFHTKPENKNPAAWTKVSSKRNYTPTQADALHLIKFVVYGEYKPGKLPKLNNDSTNSKKPNETASETTTVPQASPIQPNAPIPLGKCTYFIAPSVPKPPLRKMIAKQTDFEIDLLPENYSFTTMSWNILARRYTDRQRNSNCPDYALMWDYRKDLILDDNLLAYEPDIISLQECEDDAFESFFKPELKEEGYSSVFEKRPTVVHDGCAIFYKRSKFKLIHSTRIDYNDIENDNQLETLNLPSAGFLTNNVAIIALLEIKTKEAKHEEVYGKRYVWAINTHNYWDPQAPHIKLLQGLYLMERLEALKQKMKLTKSIPEDTPVVLMGDFNAGHKSPLYEFILNGSIKATESKERILKDVSRVKSIKHNMKWKNSHQQYGEAVTNLTINFVGCLDYIFHSPNAVALEVLENPTTSDNELLRKSIDDDDYMGCIPNPAYPSDHLPLMVKFGICMDPANKPL